MASLTPRLDNIEAGRNLVINGNFDFWQRGITALTLNNVSTFLADRWRIQNTATSNLQIDQSTDVPTVAQSGFQSRYSMKLTNSASPASPTTAFMNIRYVLEGQDYAPLHGKPFRVQFWVKSSITGNYGVVLRNNDGTRSYVSNINIAAANTWEQKVINLTGDTSGTWLFDNQAGLRLTISLNVPAANQTATLNTWIADTNSFFGSTTQAAWASTASATFFIAQISVVQGSFDVNAELPFKRMGVGIQQELALCQRYYNAVAQSGGFIPIPLVRRTNTYNFAEGFYSFPVTMRLAPTAIIPAAGSFGVYRPASDQNVANVGGSTGVGYTPANASQAYIYATNVGGNPGDTMYMNAVQLGFDAEL